MKHLPILILTAFMAVFLCAFSPAGSPVQSPASSAVPSEAVSGGGNGGGGGDPEPEGCDCIADVVDSAVAEWQAAEYSGSGDLLNLIELPSDGSAQTDNDLSIMGAAFDTDKFNLNGSSWFRYASNTTFLNSLGKTTGGSDYTFVWAGQADVSGATVQCLMSNHAGGSDPGVRMALGAGDDLIAIQRGGSSSSVDSTSTIVSATDVILIISHSHASNTTKLWVGSATGEEYSHTFNTTTSNPTGPFTIGAESDNGFPVLNGGVFYGAAILNEYITDATAIIAYFESQTGKDLTP